MTSPVRCRSCNSTNLASAGKASRARWFAGTALSPVLAGGSILRCRECNLLQRFPILSNKAYSELYASAGDHWAQSALRKDQIAVRDYIKENFRQAAKILDVGCSAGDLLASLDSHHEKFGIEPSKIASSNARARAIEIIGNSIEDISTTDLKFDVITAIDVIEHVPDPLGFLKLLSTKLSMHGQIIIATGNADARAWKFIGSSYYYSHNFEHISFISPRWCLLAKSIGLDFQLIGENYRHGDFLERGIGIMGRKYLRTLTEKIASTFEHAILARLPGITQRLGSRLCVGEPGIFRDHFLVAFRAEK